MLNDKWLNKYLSNTKWNGDCLEWQGARDSRDGYPRVVFKGNTNTRLHRLIFFTLNPEVDTGCVVRHKCDNINCINPEHLTHGTVWDNDHDRDVRLRSGSAKTNPSEVREIRDLYDGEAGTQKEIGQLYNLNCRTINSIVNRYTWKWVD